MQIKEFLTNLKNYYGEYESIVEATLAEWVMRRIEEKDLEKLWMIITENYSNTYKTPPDKARIIEIVSKHNEDKCWFQEGKLNYKQGSGYLTQEEKKIIDEGMAKRTSLVDQMYPNKEIK